MTRRPLVSVLVPAYNHERFVVECLSSILAEGYPNLEIVIVDDGSSDRTADRVREWAARFGRGIPTTFRSRHHLGVTATLNELVGLARGVYLVPIASDDRLLPGGIELRVRYMEEDPRARAVFGDCTVIDEDGRPLLQSGLVDLFQADKQRLQSDVASELIRRWSVPGPVLLIGRSALHEIGGYDDDLLVEDWDLYLRLASRNWLAFIDVAVAEYRIHSGQARLKLVDLRHAREMERIASRSLRLFRGRRRLLLLRQVMRWRTAIARLERRWLSYVAWGALSRATGMVEFR